MGFPAGLTVLIVLVLVPQTCSINDADHHCAPFSCGSIHDISYPFRLIGDPAKCGDQRYELSCENNRTVLLSLFGGEYYVRQINYNNYTIRVVDSGIQKDNYSFIPRYFLNYANFSWRGPYTTAVVNRNTSLFWSSFHMSKGVVFVNCEKPVNSTSYLDFSTCYNNGAYSSNSSSSHSERYKYVKVGRTYATDVEDSCKIEQMSLTSWPGIADPNITCTDIHDAFEYGFELSWFGFYCESCHHESCYLDDANRPHCRKYGILPFWAEIDIAVFSWGLELVRWHAAITVLGTPFVIAFLIYKWRRRHLSMYDAIEEFLQNHNNLVPIRYSFSEIKKMTKTFKEKLGEGGYGTVFKGTLRSGRLVAVKMLEKSKANGQDFINEVSTIGRIHHVNVVQLIGFCAHGSKRALIYELMPNGSLNKYIFSSEGSIPLNYEKTFNIALGVARGIEYLHRGCDMQILHFDIKPHNILLDENFTPKVSDFGLAKLYPVEDSIVYLTAARGTLGYMAPELFYKNIGGISYKADVYSFGMLLMEMVSRRKNVNAFAEHSSQIYFPTWIYDQFHDGKDIEMEDVREEEKKICTKMIIVALWCIQMKPNDRPSMNKVVKMLEGEVESLQMPPKPILSSPERVTKDSGDNSSQTRSSIQYGEWTYST